MAMKRDQCSYVDPVRTSSTTLGATSNDPTATNEITTPHRTVVAIRRPARTGGAVRLRRTMSTMRRVRCAHANSRHALEMRRLLTTNR